MSVKLLSGLRAIVNGLAEGVADFERRVYADRAAPLDVERLPCALVYVVKEEARIHTEGPLSYYCACEIAVEVRVAAGAGAAIAPNDSSRADVQLLTLLEACRRVLFLDDKIPPFVAYLRYQGCEYTLGEARGEFYFAAGRLAFEAAYIDEAPQAGDKVAQPLAGVDVKWDGAPDPEGTIDAVDRVNLNVDD